MGSAKLTIGMAVYDDIKGVKFTVQSLRALHSEVLDQCELIVVDNNPRSPQGRTTMSFVGGLVGGPAGMDGWAKGKDFAAVRYFPYEAIQGTAAPRQQVFEKARGDAVLCIDSHVILPEAGSLRRLIDYYFLHPETGDLLSGPMLYDDLRAHETHFADIWRGGMWGTWARDPRGADPDNPPFEIPAMGLGLFSCRREAWLGFNPSFREFGGEEWYIHEKFRQAGRKCICLPFLRWWHYFDDSRTYPRSTRGKIRNYIIGHQELGLPLDRVRAHFVDGVQEDGTPWAPGHRQANSITSAVFDFLVRDPDGDPTEVAAGKTSVVVASGGERPKAKVGGGCGGCGGNPMEKMTLEEMFAAVRDYPRDLNEHADKIREFASQAGRITAFVKRREWNILLAAGRPKTLLVYQTEDSPILKNVHAAIERESAVGTYSTTVGPGADSLSAVPIPATDLLVLDTVHEAGRLWAELERHGKQATKILLRGTGAFGENAEGGKGAGMRLAVRRWIKEHPEWTVVYSTQAQYGIMLLSRDERDKKQLPSTWKQGVNALKASYRAGRNVLSGYGSLKDTEAQDRRLALCLLCPSHNNGKCGECGCPVDKKTAEPTEQCPLGHWGTE